MAAGLAKAKMCRSLSKADKGRATGMERRVGSWCRRELETPQRLWTGQVGSCPPWEVGEIDLMNLGFKITGAAGWRTDAVGRGARGHC